MRLIAHGLCRITFYFPFFSVGMFPYDNRRGLILDSVLTEGGTWIGWLQLWPVLRIAVWNDRAQV